jgi:hypothetical protein
MAFFDGILYCGVNGSGLAAMTRDAAGKISFDYHPDPLIFGHRTITTLVPRQGTLAVHVYFNALLNDARQQDLSLGGISLVSYSHPALPEDESRLGSGRLCYRVGEQL